MKIAEEGLIYGQFYNNVGFGLSIVPQFMSLGGW
jgi:hypothetical protein